MKKSISELHRKIDESVKQISVCKLKLREFELGMEWMKNIENRLMKFVRRNLHSIRNTHRRKLKFLMKEKNDKKTKDINDEVQKAKDRCKKQIVYNNSSRLLSEEEVNLLSLGLNFGIKPDKFPVVEYIQATESLCQRLEKDEEQGSKDWAQRIRNIALNHIRKGCKMKIKSNLSQREKNIIRNLQKDETIVIVPADKGKAVVIEDRINYLKKMQDQIDAGDYIISTKSEKQLLKNLHKKLITQLDSMGMCSSKERRPYTVSAPVMAKMYLLIKVHKKNFPGRPVVNQIGDPTYNMCKVLTDILNPLDEGCESFISNSFELKDVLRGIEINEKSRMKSLDVNALYPSVPVEKSLKIIRERLDNDITLKDRTKWSPKEIVDLLRICLETHFKTLDGKIYTQTDGTPIGKSISGPIAGIYMDWFEKQYVYSDMCKMKPKAWKRMRDDIFFVWDHGEEEFKKFKEYLNSHEPRIQFTMEEEKDRVMAFLDLSIRRTDDSLITKVYRKDTHTYRYIHWRSNHTKKNLLGVLKGLINRAYRLCDLEDDLNEELDLLRDIFIANGYPVKRVEQTIKDYQPKCQGDDNMDVYDRMVRDNKFSGRNAICVPYIPGLFEQFQYDLAQDDADISLIPKKGKNLRGQLCKLQAKSDVEETSNVVYKIKCKTCNKVYIGETCQKYCDRRYQHQRCVINKDERNGIYIHLKENRRHKIDWDSVEFLDKEENYYSRIIKESLYINAFDQDDDFTNLMNLEKGHNINQCWREFNQQVKDSASR